MTKNQDSMSWPRLNSKYNISGTIQGATPSQPTTGNAERRNAVIRRTFRCLPVFELYQVPNLFNCFMQTPALNLIPNARRTVLLAIVIGKLHFFANLDAAFWFFSSANSSSKFIPNLCSMLFKHRSSALRI